MRPPKWLARTPAQATQSQDIEQLSRDIERRIFETLEPIDGKDAPKEILPLINIINRLISYFESRSQYEQDFSANASHELRTPLAGIRLQAELAMHSADPAIQKNACLNILTAVDRSEKLIEQLLLLARLTADRVDLEMTRVNLGQLAAGVVGEFLPVAEEKNITLMMKPWKDCYIRASEGSVSILLHNLLGNTLKYSPEGGKVEVKVESSKGSAILCVTDNGPGIPAHKYELALKRFQKVGDSAVAGSGLGLAIVKRICDLHKAALEFSKPEKGSGLKALVVFKAF